MDTIFDANVRAVIPLVTAALVRRYGGLADCEDAVQEALLEASVSWPKTGVPRDPRAWLLTVARRRYIDAVRSDAARQAREERDAALAPPGSAPTMHDDSLALLVLCCHPALQPTSRVALTLRAVCGLTTAQIAAAFYGTEATMAQRITRAKRAIDEAGRSFGELTAGMLAERAESVRTALYLMFNEGYAPSGGELPVHGELIGESIRLTRMLHAALPADSETTALLALMLLTDARTEARTDPSGLPIALPDQDRSRWDPAKLGEGRALAAQALTEGPATPLSIQAAVGAVHAAATDADATDWDQILGLYDVLVTLQPGPAAALGRAVAVGMAHGPLAGLAELALLDGDERLARGHRLLSVRAGLLERAGAFDEAEKTYAEAGMKASNAAERRWLEAQSDRLKGPAQHPTARIGRVLVVPALADPEGEEEK
ncbi:RNA polymerase sigma factor [Gryllotalpicola protaetiae]|uniref:RNA polymerase sigma factor n=1 Tax=Gryllotalpicola protaetiae TaxID=2419771 RepID=A0A387BVM4_9MICO|nr:RNA polymerase sigma factor [Gryllotalpicola protaetiae]